MPHDLTLNRRLNASPANVWRCWTEPELLKQWFAPKPVETIVAEIDPVPGGRFNTVMRVPDHGDMAGQGCILVADPARRLAWTNCLTEGFRPAARGTGEFDFPFSVEIVFTPDGDGCRYDVTVRHLTEADRDTHDRMGFADGWGAATTQLEALARGL